jgi:hypothetical protein
MCHEWYSLSPSGHEFWSLRKTTVEYLVIAGGGAGGSGAIIKAVVVRWWLPHKLYFCPCPWWRTKRVWRWRVSVESAFTATFGTAYTDNCWRLAVLDKHTQTGQVLPADQIQYFLLSLL